ncbi:MAG: 4-(cytidine 5'-diphospho)-2-C-methyl-D-erythritol kinase [Dehalococcoidia bacterium]
MTARPVRAPAKINLMLEVTGRRADGYHEIDTVLHELSLADEVSLEPGPGDVAVSGPQAAGVPSGEENVVWKAARELADRVERRDIGFSFHVHKEIPAAAGLGGGSSDAAAALRLLAREWRAPEAAVLGAAAAVGSDPPFFVKGGCARARGRGEVLDPLPPLPRHGVVLFVPSVTIDSKTATLFAALGGLPFDDGAAVDDFLREHPRELGGDRLTNSFERVAFDLFPGLGSLRAEIESATGSRTRLAGAGPTLFWIGPPPEAAAVAERAATTDCTVIATETAP